MKRVASYVVVYDISDDKERRHINKVLVGFGFRVQKSVFECRLDKRYFNELRRNLDNLNIKTGFIKIYKKEKLTKDDVLGVKKLDGVDEKNAFIF